MLDITNFGFFIISVFLLAITPGPDVAYVIGQSMANGRRAGIISAAGVAFGSCTHAVASAIGLTALITASPVTFSVIKYVGAVYLIYLGGKMLLETFREKAKENDENLQMKTQASLPGLLTKGFITTLTNPKVLLFFIAFFPQFVMPEGTHHVASFLVLGLAYALIAFLTDTTFAILAGTAANALSQNRPFQKRMNRVIGAAFIVLGIRLALTQH